MNSYADFLEKVQGEFLNGIKQAQDLNIKALAAMTELVSSIPAIDAKQALDGKNIPSASELVERSFAFTNEILDARKEYMVKLADLATEAQKQFADTAKRVAEAAKN